jgi:hypothetical protein
MANPVAYAEDTLGVNTVWTACQDASEGLITVVTELAAVRNEIRDIEAKVSYREMEVTESEWAKHPDMPVTRMDKHVKAAFLKDVDLQEFQAQLRSLRGKAERLDGMKIEGETIVRVTTARMIELGGYLQYLAAAKQAQRV